MLTNKNIANPILRILAFLIDWVISLMPVIWFLNWVSVSHDLTTFLSSTSMVLLFVFYPIVYAIFISFMVSAFGGTFGKLFTGTRIVSVDGKNLSFWEAFLRNHIGYMVSGITLWLGFVWVFIDKEKRAWHDQIVGSYVVTVNNWFAILGVIALGVLIFVEFGFISSAIINFRSNANVYADLYDTVKSSLQGLDTTTTSIDPTVNWKTYTNSVYKYSFKYPDNWKVDWPYPPDGFLFLESLNTSDFVKMIITNDSNPNSLSAKAYYEKSIADASKKGLKPIPPDGGTEEIVINGMKAFHTIHNFGGVGGVSHYYLTNGKVVVDISFHDDLNNPNYPNNASYIQLFTKVLSTFQFEK